METTKGTVGWLLKNALAIDMETSINGREIKSWATAIFNIEEERVTENNFGDNADGLKVIIGQTRQNCGLIVGHNIREHDLKTLFGEGDLLNYVLSYTWDTYLIEQCLNPLRPSYALKTTHIPQDDAKLGFELFIRQAIVISKDIELFNRMKPVLPPSFKGRPKTMASFPSIFKNVNGEERESFFLRKRDIPEILKNETKTISPEEKTLLIAPELLWDCLSRDDLKPLFIRTNDTGPNDDGFSAVRIAEPKNYNTIGSTIAKSLLSNLNVKPFNKVYVNNHILERIAEFTDEQSIDDLEESCHNYNVLCVDPSSVRDSHNHFTTIVDRFRPDKVIVLWLELDSDCNQDLSSLKDNIPESIISVRSFPGQLEMLRDSSIKDCQSISAMESIKRMDGPNPKALICSSDIIKRPLEDCPSELDYVSSPYNRPDRRLAICKEKKRSFTAISNKEILRWKTSFNMNVDYVLVTGSIPECHNAARRAFFKQELLTACGNGFSATIEECDYYSEGETY